MFQKLNIAADRHSGPFGLDEALAPPAHKDGEGAAAPMGLPGRGNVIATRGVPAYSGEANVFDDITARLDLVPAYVGAAIAIKQAPAVIAAPRREAPAPRSPGSTLQRLTSVGALRMLQVAALTLRHRAALKPFRRAGSRSLLARVLADRPEIRSMVLTPYVCAEWDAETRLGRIAEHCAIAEELGACFALTSRDYVELIELPQIGANYRVTLDSPRWMTRDGLLTLSMWHEANRIFSLSFTLAREEGELVAFVGGVQGQRSEGSLDLYRAFTKAAHGVRPRDMMIELFRMLAHAVGVLAIRCVSDGNRYQRSAYAMARTRGADPVDLDYDAIWADRGATQGEDGFFALPVVAIRRAVEDIPANKRSLYRKRYAMLDEVAQTMTAVMHARASLPVKQH